MWARVERLLSDNETRAALLRWFWLISTGVLVIGFAVIGWRAVTPP